MFKHILIPTDGSGLATKALREGLELAKSIGARVTILTVTEPFHVFTADVEMVEDTPEKYKEATEAQSHRVLDAAKAEAERIGVPCLTSHRSHDEPYEAIIREAENSGCDLITMSSHGRRGIAAVLLGSETQKVLTHTTVPVLVFR